LNAFEPNAGYAHTRATEVCGDDVLANAGAQADDTVLVEDILVAQRLGQQQVALKRGLRS